MSSRAGPSSSPTCCSMSHPRARRCASSASAAFSASTMASAFAVAVGRSSQATMPDATTTTTAATHSVEVKASTNEVCAACATAPALRPAVRGGGLQRVGRRVRRLLGRTTHRALHRGTEVRGHQGAEHRDSERTTELTRGVVHRRTDADLVQRQRSHDRPRRRRGGDAHAERLHHDREREPSVDRRHRPRHRQDRDAEPGDGEARRHYRPLAVALHQLRRLRRRDQVGERARQDPEAWPTAGRSRARIAGTG